MPDWNPAEIIGLKPGPLALSLYRELVTDSIWAYQRDNYGYKNLRSFPLLVSFHGLPYIDVRVSFNSFVPRDISGRSGRAAGQLLHRPAAGAAELARQGRIRDHFLVLHAGLAGAARRLGESTAFRPEDRDIARRVAARPNQSYHQWCDRVVAAGSRQGRHSG